MKKTKKILVTMLLLLLVMLLAGMPVSAKSHHRRRRRKVHTATVLTGPYVTPTSMVTQSAERSAVMYANTKFGRLRFYSVNQSLMGDQYEKDHGCASCATAVVLGARVPSLQGITGLQVHYELEKQVMEERVSSGMPLSLNCIQAILAKFGVPTRYVYSFNRNKLAGDFKKLLLEGNVLVVNCCTHNYRTHRNNPKYSHSNHTVVLFGITETGKAIMADSANFGWSGSYQRFKLVDLKDFANYVTRKTNNRVTKYYSGRSVNGGYLILG